MVYGAENTPCISTDSQPLFPWTLLNRQHGRLPRNEGSLKLILVATQYPSFPEMSMAQKLLSHELVETDGAKAIVEMTLEPQ